MDVPVATAAVAVARADNDQDDDGDDDNGDGEKNKNDDDRHYKNDDGIKRSGAMGTGDDADDGEEDVQVEENSDGNKRHRSDADGGSKNATKKSRPNVIVLTKAAFLNDEQDKFVSEPLGQGESGYFQRCILKALEENNHIIEDGKKRSDGATRMELGPLVERMSGKKLVMVFID